MNLIHLDSEAQNNSFDQYYHHGQLWTYFYNPKELQKIYLELKNRVLSFISQATKEEYFLIIENHEIMINKRINPKVDNKYKYSFLIYKDGVKAEFFHDNLNEIITWHEKLLKCSINSSLKSQYQLSECIHQGLSSKIMKATSKFDGKNYAAKFIPKSTQNRLKQDDPLNEVILLRKLNHPNIIRIYEAYEDENFIIMILEWIKDGDLLQRLLQNGNVKEPEAAYICYQLMEILIYLQDYRILHNNIKLENILIDNQNTQANNHFSIKLASFGLADYMDIKSILNNIVESPCYIAPEGFQNNQVIDYKSDLFSVGIVIFELLTGSWAFERENLLEIMKNKKEGKIRLIEQKWENISNEARELISSMITIDPHQRPTAKQILESKWIKDNYLKFTHNDISLNEIKDSDIKFSNVFPLFLTSLLISICPKDQIDPSSEYKRKRLLQHKTIQNIQTIDSDEDLRCLLRIFSITEENFQEKIELEEKVQKRRDEICEPFQNDSTALQTENAIIFQPYIFTIPITLGKLNYISSSNNLDKFSEKNKELIQISKINLPLIQKLPKFSDDYEIYEENFDDKINENGLTSHTFLQSLVELGKKPLFSDLDLSSKINKRN